MAFRLTPFIIVSLLFTTKARITVVIRARGCRNCLVVRYTNRYSCCGYIRQHTIGYSHSIVWASYTLVSIYLLAFRTTETSYVSSIRLQACKRFFQYVCATLCAVSDLTSKERDGVYISFFYLHKFDRKGTAFFRHYLYTYINYLAFSLILRFLLSCFDTLQINL